jgi:hypothetical protein
MIEFLGLVLVLGPPDVGQRAKSLRVLVRRLGRIFQQLPAGLKTFDVVATAAQLAHRYPKYPLLHLGYHLAFLNSKMTCHRGRDSITGSARIKREIKQKETLHVVLWLVEAEMLGGLS